MSAPHYPVLACLDRPDMSRKQKYPRGDHSNRNSSHSRSSSTRTRCPQVRPRQIAAFELNALEMNVVYQRHIGHDELTPPTSEVLICRRVLGLEISTTLSTLRFPDSQRLVVGGEEFSTLESTKIKGSLGPILWHWIPEFRSREALRVLAKGTLCVRCGLNSHRGILSTASLEGRKGIVARNLGPAVVHVCGFKEAVHTDRKASKKSLYCPFSDHPGGSRGSERLKCLEPQHEKHLEVKACCA